jgi:hypothetical protein
MGIELKKCDDSTRTDSYTKKRGILKLRDYIMELLHMKQKKGLTIPLFTTFFVALIANISTTLNVHEPTIFGMIASIVYMLTWLLSTYYWKSKWFTIMGLLLWVITSIISIIWMVNPAVVSSHGLFLGFIVLFDVPLGGFVYAFKNNEEIFVHIFAFIMFAIFTLKMLRLVQSRELVWYRKKARN